MEKLEKVELIREKTGVSYDDANVALEAAGGDVLDAIIWLERMGKAETQSAAYTTASFATAGNASADDAYAYASPEMAQAQTAYQQASKKSGFENFWNAVKRLLKKGMETTFVAERNGERVIVLPVLILILGFFLAGATLWLIIIGLFFGFHYHIEGTTTVTDDVNKVMNKASNLADSIKETITSDEGN